MSTFSLSQTGTEINSAIGKVHNADTTPTQGSTNMVTSGGVYTALRRFNSWQSVNNSGTASSDGFLLVQYTGAKDGVDTLQVVVGSATFKGTSGYDVFAGTQDTHKFLTMCVPIASGETWNVSLSFNQSTSYTLDTKFRSLA